MSYETPPLYMAAHVIGGFISYYYPVLIALFVAYQLLQLILGIRFFVFMMEIREGNSILYTLYKLAQFFAGYLVAAAPSFFQQNRRPT